MDQLINEICEICHRVEPDVKSSSMFRRVQFMGFELSSQVSPEATTIEKLHALNRFFFELKDFSVPSAPTFHDPLSLHLLNRVLNSRVGSSRALAILYRYLGEQIGLRFEFVDLQPNCYLKYVDRGVSRYIDFSRQGRVLTSDELLETLQSRAQSKVELDTLCESVGADNYVVEYLHVLKGAFQQRNNVEPLLVVQNWILEYQPSNMAVIAERALLLNQLGHFKTAFSDLKRYFTFSERGSAPKELVVLFDELSSRFALKPADVTLH